MLALAISLLAVSLLAAPVAAWAEVPSYSVVKEKSSLKFIALQNSAPVEGRFDDYMATIRFDPDHPEQSHIAVEVAIGSVRVANEDVQKNIVLPEWLSAEAFPKAIFTSKTISRTPMTDDYYVEGDLQLRGETAPVVLNFQLQQTGDVAIARGYATLKRTDYGVGQGEWAKDDVIKDEVRVEFRIVATKSP